MLLHIPSNRSMFRHQSFEELKFITKLLDLLIGRFKLIKPDQRLVNKKGFFTVSLCLTCTCYLTRIELTNAAFSVTPYSVFILFYHILAEL